MSNTPAERCYHDSYLANVLLLLPRPSTYQIAQTDSTLDDLMITQRRQDEGRNRSITNWRPTPSNDELVEPRIVERY